MRPGYAGIYTNLQMVCFEYPQKSPLKSSHPKKYLPKFPNQKKPGIENFKPQKTFDHPCHLKSGVSQPPPPRSTSWAVYVKATGRQENVQD